MSLRAASGRFDLFLFSCSALLGASLSPVTIGMFPDGQEDGNVPTIVLLAEPEVWPLQMLDSLTQLDQVVLRSYQT